VLQTIKITIVIIALLLTSYGDFENGFIEIDDEPVIVEFGLIWIQNESIATK
jgi:hypothetical protein